MSKDEIEIEKPNEIIDTVAQILEYNGEQTQEAKGSK